VSLTPLTYKAVIIRELTFSMTGPPPLENQYILVFYWMVFPCLAYDLIAPAEGLFI